MNKSNGTIWIVIIIIIVIGIIAWKASANKKNSTNNQTSTQSATTSANDAGKLGPNETEITAKNFDTEVVQASKKQLVIIDIYASWCPHCQRMGPVFTDLSDQYKGKVKFGKMNADYQDSSVKENYDFVASKGFEGYPTFWFYKDGKEIYKFSGEADKATFQSYIEKYK